VVMLQVEGIRGGTKWHLSCPGVQCPGYWRPHGNRRHLRPIEGKEKLETESNE
jgi:hypothetical protein